MKLFLMTAASLCIALGVVISQKSNGRTAYVVPASQSGQAIDLWASDEMAQELIEQLEMGGRIRLTLQGSKVVSVEALDDYLDYADESDKLKN